jgi:hypothetical protein
MDTNYTNVKVQILDQQWPCTPIAYSSENFTVEISELHQLFKQTELLVKESKSVIANSQDLRERVRRIRKESRSLYKERQDLLFSLEAGEYVPFGR